MKTKIALIGLGNIGKRHLQAVSKSANVSKIMCLDTDAGSCESLKPFCEENGIPLEKIELHRNLDTIIGKISRNTIAIVATTAPGREGILQRLMLRRPLSVIAEKPLCINKEEYDSIRFTSESLKVPVYVNLARRIFGFYNAILNDTKTAKKKSFDITFWGGISCIGIHMFDLASWLMDSDKYKVIRSAKGEVYDTKRIGFRDFSGSLTVEYANGATGVFNASREVCLFSIVITTENRQYAIYEAGKKIVISDANGNVDVRDIEIPVVSHMTTKVVEDIASGRKPQLPDIKDAFISHAMLFDFIKQHRLGDVKIT